MLYYAVARGRATGIYTSREIAQQQIEGFPGADMAIFDTYNEARSFLRSNVRTIEVYTEGVTRSNLDGTTDAGVGVYIPAQHARQQMCVSLHLEGPLQTSKRAKMRAIVEGIRKARGMDPESRCIVYTDSDDVIRAAREFQMALRENISTTGEDGLKFEEQDLLRLIQKECVKCEHCPRFRLVRPYELNNESNRRAGILATQGIQSPWDRQWSFLAELNSETT